MAGFVLGHDDPTPGLSTRGLLTIALAAAVVVLLTIHRAAGPGPLARALAEYAVVFLLAVLVATTRRRPSTSPPPPAEPEQASAAPTSGPRWSRPSTWSGPAGRRRRLAGRPVAPRRPADRPPPPALPDPNGQAMAPSPACPTSTRRPL